MNLHGGTSTETYDFRLDRACSNSVAASRSVTGQSGSIVAPLECRMSVQSGRIVNCGLNTARQQGAANDLDGDLDRVLMIRQRLNRAFGRRRRPSWTTVPTPRHNIGHAPVAARCPPTYQGEAHEGLQLGSRPTVS